MKGLFQCPPRAAPWVIMDASLSPCKGKSFKRIRQFTKLLPLQGALLIAIIPRAMPWARSFWAFSPYLNHLRNFNYLLMLLQPYYILGAKVLQKIEFHKSERKFFAPPYFFGTKVSQV